MLQLWEMYAFDRDCISVILTKFLNNSKILKFLNEQLKTTESVSTAKSPGHDLHITFNLLPTNIVWAGQGQNHRPSVVA